MTDILNHDVNRDVRTSIPEVVLAEPKHIIDLIEVLENSLKNKERLLITRILSNQVQAILDFVAENKKFITFDRYQSTSIISNNEIVDENKLESNVAVISAGTSDNPVVEEILFTLKYMKIGYEKHIDVGVAGYHRHQIALDQIIQNKKIKAIIVVAGQDGALFPVIAGQTKLPVICVPTSIGYGKGGKGEGALMTALQSCSPGTVVVNIDNGFGSAVFVAKILNLFS